MKLFISPPTEKEVIYDKAWELVNFFRKSFPKCQIKVDVKYVGDECFVIEHKEA